MQHNCCFAQVQHQKTNAAIKNSQPNVNTKTNSSAKGKTCTNHGKRLYDKIGWLKLCEEKNKNKKDTLWTCKVLWFWAYLSYYFNSVFWLVKNNLYAIISTSTNWGIKDKLQTLYAVLLILLCIFFLIKYYFCLKWKRLLGWQEICFQVYRVNVFMFCPAIPSCC